MSGSRQWWAPVWNGLVMDPQAKHYKGMKNALWLFLYLVLSANRHTGFLVRKTTTMARDIGVSRDTVLRWLHVLRQGGYIRTSSNGRSLTIQVTKWKSIVGVGKDTQQQRQESNTTSWKNPTPSLPAEAPNPVHSGSETARLLLPKESNDK